MSSSREEVSYMNRKQAKEVAMGLNIKPGETITFQGTGQIENSHQHNRSDTGPSHVDGWIATNNGSTVSLKKGHSDD